MKIFIDAGHNYSGFNTGATGNGLREQDITFSVAEKLGNILLAKGLEIKLSRPTLQTNLGTDNSSSINTRYTLANDWHADYFISIHCNSGGGTGAETLYYKQDSLEYAQVIQNSYVAETGLANRGVKYRDNVGVIMYTKMPSILLELAFIDNVSDAEMLRNQQELIAQGIAQGFYTFLGIDENEEDVEMRYNTLNQVPDWGKDTVEKLIEKGYLAGDGANLDLSLDMIRVFVVHDRAGFYG